MSNYGQRCIKHWPGKRSRNVTAESLTKLSHELSRTTLEKCYSRVPDKAESCTAPDNAGEMLQQSHWQSWVMHCSRQRRRDVTAESLTKKSHALLQTTLGKCYSRVLDKEETCTAPDNAGGMLQSPLQNWVMHFPGQRWKMLQSPWQSWVMHCSG
jgi:hypothetical protein